MNNVKAKLFLELMKIDWLYFFNQFFYAVLYLHQIYLSYCMNETSLKNLANALVKNKNCVVCIQTRVFCMQFCFPDYTIIIACSSVIMIEVQ